MWGKIKMQVSEKYFGKIELGIPAIFVNSKNATVFLL